MQHENRMKLALLSYFLACSVPVFVLFVTGNCTVSYQAGKLEVTLSAKSFAELASAAARLDRHTAVSVMFRRRDCRILDSKN